MTDSLGAISHPGILSTQPLLHFGCGARLDKAPELVLSGPKQILGPHMGVLPVHCGDGFAGEIEVDILGIDALESSAASAPELLAWRELDIFE